jgi:hypothetical protein
MLHNNFSLHNKCKDCHIKHLKRYEWTLIKNKKYLKKKENFISLCPRCHKIYDNTMPINRFIRKKLAGSVNDEFNSSK